MVGRLDDRQGQRHGRVEEVFDDMIRWHTQGQAGTTNLKPWYSRKVNS